MIEHKFNDGWKFWIDRNAFALVWNIPEHAKEITLPHDAMIEKKAYAESANKGNTGFHDGDIYHYVKMIDVPEFYRHKTIKLKFEGIYMNSFIYVNGNLAGQCPFGYSTFYVDLSPFLKFGTQNEIRVIVRNGAMTNSRWYSGGGIYRDAYLLVSDLTYIAEDGVKIKTESCSEDYATVFVETTLKTRHYASTSLILETQILDKNEEQVAFDRVPYVIFEQDERKIAQRLVIDEPSCWSDENPDLYQCISRLYVEDQQIDETTTTFGIRTLYLDTKQGLQVNQKTVKLRGACIHHDSGLIGAATYEEAQYRQIKILKESGFNAVRMSHHPMAPAMLKACDRLGMYVMDETFDMWTRCKSDFDYGMNFQDWWKKDVELMVQKNYNHPSVILYSIGNEIPEIGSDHGVRIAYQICEAIKDLDPTRYTLASINGVFAAGDTIDTIVEDVVSELKSQGVPMGDVNNFMTLMDKHMDAIVLHPEITKRLEKACAATDIAGYNYMTARYETDGEIYPNRIIVGSETYPPEIARNWGLVKKLPYVIGDFTWTGWEYIGEAGVGVPAYQWGDGGFGAKFPCQLAYCGDIDLTGFRRPASYYREIVFGLRKKPYIAVQNPYHYGEHLIKTPWVISDSQHAWSYSECEGKPVVIEIYSPGDEVELYCNGKLLGKEIAGSSVDFIARFTTIYEPGELVAITYEKGTEIGRDILTTAQDTFSLKMSHETVSFEELVYVNLELKDENDVLVTHKDHEIEIEIQGSGHLIGFGSADPKTAYHYGDKVTGTYFGRAQAIIKWNGGIEPIKITVKYGTDKTLVAEYTIEIIIPHNN